MDSPGGSEDAQLSPTPATMPRARRIVVPSARVLDALRVEGDGEAAARIRRVLTKGVEDNCRLIRPDEPPMADVEPGLADKVRALEEEAAELSRDVRAVRAAAVPVVRAAVESTVDGLATVVVPDVSADEKEIVRVESAGAADVGVVAGRVRKLYADARGTAARAAKLRDVLAMMEEGSDGDGDVTATIVADWGAALVSSSGFNIRRGAGKVATPIPASKSGIPEMRLSSRKSPYSALAEPAVAALSPHVTPRSRSRKRLVGVGAVGAQSPMVAKLFPR